jgi:hypothetical protein
MSAEGRPRVARNPPHGRAKAGCVQFAFALRERGEALPAKRASPGEVTP